MFTEPNPRQNCPVKIWHYIAALFRGFICALALRPNRSMSAQVKPGNETRCCIWLLNNSLLNSPLLPPSLSSSLPPSLRSTQETTQQTCSWRRGMGSSSERLRRREDSSWPYQASSTLTIGQTRCKNKRVTSVIGVIHPLRLLSLIVR